MKCGYFNALLRTENIFWPLSQAHDYFIDIMWYWNKEEGLEHTEQGRDGCRPELFVSGTQISDHDAYKMKKREKRKGERERENTLCANDLIEQTSGELASSQVGKWSVKFEKRISECINS